MLGRALRTATLACAVAGCARGASERTDPADAAPQVDAAAEDARVEVTADAALDAGCAISTGVTPTLDGSGDLAAYPAAQQLALGATLGSDAAAIAWDSSHLFVTVSSDAFTAPYEPLHIYLEAATTLATAVPSPGKEYGGLIAAVPFVPTHLIAVRRVSDAGTGAYNGVFVPSDAWTTRTLALDTATLASADHRTLSVSVPWSTLGTCPTALRLAIHVVHGQAANEWKDLVPSTHTPWQMPGGGFYEIDLTGSPAVAGWTLR